MQREWATGLEDMAGMVDMLPERETKKLYGSDLTRCRGKGALGISTADLRHY